MEFINKHHILGALPASFSGANSGVEAVSSRLSSRCLEGPHGQMLLGHTQCLIGYDAVCVTWFIGAY
jgi:hypothetical protein